MVASYQIYNTTPLGFLAQTIHLGNLKLMLLDNDAVFNAAHTTLIQVAGTGNANEIAGNGWTVGGEAVVVGSETYNTNAARLTASQISKTATGGDIGTAYKYVIYDDADASDKPVGFCTFEGARVANEGTPFIIEFPDEGIFFIEPES